MTIVGTLHCRDCFDFFGKLLKVKANAEFLNQCKQVEEREKTCAEQPVSSRVDSKWFGKVQVCEFCRGQDVFRVQPQMTEPLDQRLLKIKWVAKLAAEQNQLCSAAVLSPIQSQQSHPLHATNSLDICETADAKKQNSAQVSHSLQDFRSWKNSLWSD